MNLSHIGLITVLLGAAGAIGFASGRLGDSVSHKGNKVVLSEASPKEEPSVQRSSSPAVDMLQLEHVIRASVREEIEAQKQQAGSLQKDENKKEELPLEVAEKQRQFREESLQLVKHAVANKKWTGQDRNELRKRLPMMSKEDREEIFRQLIPAINRQEVKVELRGAPI